MPEFWKAVNKVIEEADIIIEVLDARNTEETRNREIENKIKKAGKKIILAANKSDLAEKTETEGAIPVSSTKYTGVRRLKERIIIEGKRLGVEKPKVGVVGYPNVGKSSIINALKGKASAKTSPQSGFTKGAQKISAKKFILIDTPGVMPYKEKAGALTGAVDFSKIKDPELAVFEIMEKYPSLIQEHYGIKGEYEQFIEKFAEKRNMLSKGAEPDTRRAATAILRDWQTGKIKINHSPQSSSLPSSSPS